MGMRIRPSRESITQSQREHIGFGVALIGLTSRLQAVPRVWSGALSPAPESSFVRFDSDREERRLAASEYHSDAGSGSPQSQLGTSVGRTLVLLDVIRRYCGAVIIGRRPLRRQILSSLGVARICRGCWPSRGRRYGWGPRTMAALSVDLRARMDE
jgi:hypothetical protein